MDDAKLAIIPRKEAQTYHRTTDPLHYSMRCINCLHPSYNRRESAAKWTVIGKSQFGFRKGKSTSQPLFIRRTQEIQEEAALESHLLLLDWEKAFDKVSQSRMMRAIRRLGIPEKITNMIKAIYLEPNYVITDKDVTTTPRIQKTGI